MVENISATMLVIGAGSWGTAIAMHLARCGHKVLLWGNDEQEMSDLAKFRTHEKYLPGILLPEQITIVSDLAAAIQTANFIFCMVPSSAFRIVLTQIKPYYNSNTPFIWGTKGILATSNAFTTLSEAVTDILGEIDMAVLAGPSFAIEVAQELPTAIVLSGNNNQVFTALARMLNSDKFRVYTNEDMLGVQLCGAIKNVLAVATGIAAGLNLGVNAESALITRGLVEMQTLVKTAGGSADTVMGLTGMGDLILTCMSDKSRNRRLGKAIGSGKSIADAKTEIGQVVESLDNAQTLLNFAIKHKLSLPIITQVCKVLSDVDTPEQAMYNLLSRPQCSE